MASMEEQLSGACTVEIAAFDEFTMLLGDKQATAAFDYLIFDTAPTGHTLRLLKLPAAWTGFIAENTTGTSCLGPLSGLQMQRGPVRGELPDPWRPRDDDARAGQPAGAVRAGRGGPHAGRACRHGLTNQHLFLNGRLQASIGHRRPGAVRARGPRSSALRNMPKVSLAALPRLARCRCSRLLPWAWPILGASSMRAHLRRRLALPRIVSYPGNTCPGPGPR